MSIRFLFFFFHGHLYSAPESSSPILNIYLVSHTTPHQWLASCCISAQYSPALSLLPHSLHTLPLTHCALKMNTKESDMKGLSHSPPPSNSRTSWFKDNSVLCACVVLCSPSPKKTLFIFSTRCDVLCFDDCLIVVIVTRVPIASIRSSSLSLSRLAVCPLNLSLYLLLRISRCIGHFPSYCFEPLISANLCHPSPLSTESKDGHGRDHSVA